MDSIGAPDRNAGHQKRESGMSVVDTIGEEIGMPDTRKIAVSDMAQTDHVPDEHELEKEK